MSDLDPALVSDAQQRIFASPGCACWVSSGPPSGAWASGNKSLRALADELGDLERDVVEALARSLPEVTEEDIAPLLGENAKA